MHEAFLNRSYQRPTAKTRSFAFTVVDVVGDLLIIVDHDAQETSLPVTILEDALSCGILQDVTGEAS